MQTITKTMCTLAAWAGLGVATAATVGPLEHAGMCDASAAVSVGNDQFLVANDEDNFLRLYSASQPGKALQEFVIPSLPVLPGTKHGEVDIEGAARIGKRIYWIASHGANRKGEARPHRRQFFATDVDTIDGKLTLTEAGRSSTNLLATMAELPGLKKFNLPAAAQRAPEAAGGLNIEGMAAMPGGGLLIGFRNPSPGGKALLVSLKNPDAVINGVAPLWDEPLELALEGLGVRSIEYADALKTYLIVAGPQQSAGAFKLFAWAGDPKLAPVLLKVAFNGSLRPEALFATGDGKGFRVLSDDGDEQVGAQDCKDAPASARKFRSMDVPAFKVPALNTAKATVLPARAAGR